VRTGLPRRHHSRERHQALLALREAAVFDDLAGRIDAARNALADAPRPGPPKTPSRGFESGLAANGAGEDAKSRGGRTIRQAEERPPTGA